MELRFENIDDPKPLFGSVRVGQGFSVQGAGGVSTYIKCASTQAIPVTGLGNIIPAFNTFASDAPVEQVFDLSMTWTRVR